MTTVARQQRPLLIRITPEMVVLLLVAAAAASWTFIRADGMWDMPGPDHGAHGRPHHRG